MTQLGAAFAGGVSPGDVFRLIGELGAGKTTFARGFIRGLGYRGEVRSPTFNLVHEYDTEPPVCHVDLYRLDSPAEVAELGLSDYMSTHVVLVEWAERAGDLLPEDAMTIKFEIDGARRRIVVEEPVS